MLSQLSANQKTLSWGWVDDNDGKIVIIDGVISPTESYHPIWYPQ